MSLSEVQPTLNIGTIGHVAHGKSTLVKALSGIKTVRFKSELERNITIKLGYANCKIYECSKCPRPIKYQVGSTQCKNTDCNNKLSLVKHISFIDCPGHDILMATMLSGASLMHGSLLLIAANEKCPQPQTKEHLFAVEIMGNSNTIIMQNKIDLISREECISNYNEIQQFIKGTIAHNAPIIPISAQKEININALLDFIVHRFPEPEIKRDEPCKMGIIRSFDINKPGKIKWDSLQGGVIGGSISKGVLKVGDEVEIRPGIVKDGMCTPFYTTITSLKSDTHSLSSAQPGGLIGVGTLLDPFYIKSDKIVGQVLGHRNTLPPVHCEIITTHNLFTKVGSGRVEKLVVGESLLINIGSIKVGGTITEIDDTLHIKLMEPVCCDIKERIAISRKIKRSWRLIGHGVILKGKEVKIF